MNNSLGNSPQLCTISAFDKNFNANASSINPNETFTLCNHPPDFGSLLKTLGKNDIKPKGNANAVPKPSIPAVSCVAPPSAVRDPTNSEPKIGPVHEKETKASVNAIKKIPRYEDFAEASSDLEDQEVGSRNSNKPKKDNANIKKTTKKIIFNTTFVAIEFSTSGRSWSKKWKGKLRSPYIPMIENVYAKERFIPCDRLELLLEK